MDVAALLTPFGHEPFIGCTRLMLPSNGRIALPAHFRPMFGDSARLLPVAGERVQLYTPSSFEAVAKEIVASAADMAVDGKPSSLIHPRSRKWFFMASTRVSVDAQGRFVLPAELRGAVGIELGHEIVLAGADETIEIWSAPRFDAADGSQLGEIDMLLKDFPGFNR